MTLLQLIFADVLFGELLRLVKNKRQWKSCLQTSFLYFYAMNNTCTHNYNIWNLRNSVGHKLT